MTTVVIAYYIVLGIWLIKSFKEKDFDSVMIEITLFAFPVILALIILKDS